MAINKACRYSYLFQALKGKAFSSVFSAGDGGEGKGWVDGALDFCIRVSKAGLR